MQPSTIALGYAEGLGGVFAIAASHKVMVLSRGRAANEALFRITPRRSHAAPLLLAAAAVAEAFVTVLVLVDARASLGLAVALLALYWRELSKLGPNDTCACFGGFAQTPAQGARIRNLALGVAALVAYTVLQFSGSLPAASAQSAAIALVVVSVVILPSILLAQTLKVLTVREPTP